MKWRWMCLAAILLVAGCSESGNSDTPNGPESSTEMQHAKAQDENVESEETQIALIRQYVEAVYETGEKDLQEELGNVVSESLLKDYAAGTNAAIDAREYTAQIEDPFYYANEDGAVAIFTVVSTTELNVTRQTYLLQVGIRNERIDEIVRMEVLER